MTSTVYKNEELDGGYEFGDCQTPEGFDPEASGYRNAPVGDYKMYLATFDIAVDHEFKCRPSKGEPVETYVLNQIRPHLVIADGEREAGATIMDFLAMPTPGQDWPARLANQWANFLRAFGFQPPANKIVPDGFKIEKGFIGVGLSNMIGDGKSGPFAVVKIVKSLDVDGNPRLTKSGEERNQVSIFGYSPIGQGPTKPASQRKQAQPSAPAKAAEEAKASDDWDL